MYYAEHNPYGITFANCNTLHAFETREERDEWVADDDWDGEYHRIAVTRRQAERRFPRAFRGHLKDDWERTSNGKVYRHAN